LPWLLALLVLRVKSTHYPILKRFDSELIYDGGLFSVTIFCRYGGAYSTSSAEALLRSGRGCLNPLLYEVIHSPWRRGGPWLLIVAGRGLPSSWSLILGGDALRTPAMGGKDAQGHDCFLSFCSRVFCVKGMALSGWWFYPGNAMSKDHFYKMYSPRDK
jgi:hypothetical protein